MAREGPGNGDVLIYLLLYSNEMTNFTVLQGFCLKVSEDLFYRTHACIFVGNRLCMVFPKTAGWVCGGESFLKISLRFLKLFGRYEKFLCRY